MPTTLSPESAAELAQLRASIDRDGLWDETRRRFIGYRPQIVDYYDEQPFGFTVTDEEQEARRVERDDAATVAWLHRDPADDVILRRWHRPTEELDFFEQLDQDAELRERQLVRLLRTYFGVTDNSFMGREIVLRWEASGNGRFRPAEKMLVSDWIEKAITDRDDDRLRGLAYAVGHLRSRITRRVIANDKTRQSGGWWQTYDLI